jgi:cell division protein FtsB
MAWLKYTKNFYFIFTVLFVFWMIFVDSNNIYSQYQLSKKLNELKSQKEFFEERKRNVLANKEELLSNEELLEKFARERYLMKRKNEDLYVIVKE